MRKLLVGLALLALPWAVQAETLIGQQEFARTARDTLWLTYSAADTTHPTRFGPADTLGPVFIGNCPKTRIAASWKGDSVAVYFEASVDKTNWATFSTSFDGDLFGTAATQGDYIYTILQDNVAAGSLLGNATAGQRPWVRARFVSTSKAPAYILNLVGYITCVR